MSIAQLRQRIELTRELTGLEKQDIYDVANRSVDPKTLGKPKLRRYAIACRPIFGAWINDDPVIINARHAHDQGYGVMFSETVGEWCILYYAQHAYRVKRKPYFNSGSDEDDGSS